ncbi:hypothetical protein [Microbacterium resistens]
MSTLVFRVSAVVGSLVVVGIIIWVDVATSVWQNYAVVSGLAGGLVTFLLTAAVVDKVIARSTHERWAPVTRLALGDLRRSLAADPRDPAAGMRRLPDPDPASARALVDAAAEERDAIAAALGRWSSFLAASADVAGVMDALAELAERLDRIDEHARRIDAGPADSAALLVELRGEIAGYRAAGDALFHHLGAALDGYRFPRRTGSRRAAIAQPG